MQYGEVIKPVEGATVPLGIIVDADLLVLPFKNKKDQATVLDNARMLGPRVVLLTTHSGEELDGEVWRGRPRVYQQGEAREEAIRKAMGLMGVVRAVVVGRDPTEEGRQLSYKHWSEAWTSMFPVPGAPKPLEG